MKKFRTVRYKVDTQGRIKEDICCLCISDLHGICYGRKNEPVIEKARMIQPDLILIPGDVITKKKPDSCKVAISLLAELKGIAPVFFVNGNHETAMAQDLATQHHYRRFMDALEEHGITVLNNDSVQLHVRGTVIGIYGLELDYGFYGRFSRVKLPVSKMEQMLGEKGREEYTILMAHTPAFFQTYAGWSADLTVSGHYHGGFARIPFLGGIISPQMRLFPKYDRGLFAMEHKYMAVSAGLGGHSFVPRLNNPMELLQIDLLRNSTIDTER